MKYTLWPRDRRNSFLVPPFYRVWWDLQAHMKLKSLYSAEERKWFEQPLFFYIAAWVGCFTTQNDSLSFWLPKHDTFVNHVLITAGLWGPVWTRRRESSFVVGCCWKPDAGLGCVCVGRSQWSEACTLIPYDGRGQCLREWGLEWDHEVSSPCSARRAWWPWTSYPAFIFLIT